jgi:regulator of sigma E protease
MTCWTLDRRAREAAQRHAKELARDHRSCVPAHAGRAVVVHEYGHYRVAVACGVKVLRFSVGFGRVLWRRQKGRDATEFVVCALPLGGYVRMLDEREGPVPRTNSLAPSTASRCGHAPPSWLAGPLANLLLAVLLYASAH